MAERVVEEAQSALLEELGRSCEVGEARRVVEERTREHPGFLGEPFFEKRPDAEVHLERGDVEGEHEFLVLAQALERLWGGSLCSGGNVIEESLELLH